MKYLSEFLQIPAISIIIGAILTIITTNFNDKMRLKREIKLNKYKDMKRAYYKLIGLCYKFYQLDYRRLESVINNWYYAQLKMIKNLNSNSLEAKESIRNGLKSEEYNKEIVLCNQELYGVFGELEILFSENDKISECVKSIMKINPLVLKDFPGDKSTQIELDKWKLDELKNIGDYINKVYKDKFNVLNNEISEEINKQNI